MTQLSLSTVIRRSGHASIQSGGVSWLGLTSFDLVIDRLAPLDVARQVAQVTFLPVIAGFLFRYFLPGLADCIGNPLRILGNILLTILLLAVVVIPAIGPDLRIMLNLGWEATMAHCAHGGSIAGIYRIDILEIYLTLADELPEQAA